VTYIDETTNLAPLSSFWVPCWPLMLGLLDEARTTEKLARDPEWVINLPSAEMWRQVEKLAALTGKNPSRRLRPRSFGSKRTSSVRLA
jgi:flavin reductase (DIM6/NTAB) family NADH-FMN oxidoreductase RutF